MKGQEVMEGKDNRKEEKRKVKQGKGLEGNRS